MAGNTIGTAYVKIMPEASGISGQISGIMNPAATSAGTSAGKLSGAALVKSLVKVVAAAGVGKAISASLFAGADLQQSIGGIETLYKDSADKMKAYAEQSYKTTGLSANDYMQATTSYSAALISGYGGDVDKAADAANQAMIDMADNANKMGTPIESIQDAYMSFSRGQYQLLDNLKLGYGGTKTEMERLLKDAQAITGVEYDINNLGDVYEAIHVIQGEIGITGTTQKEAAETISGSISMMKASYQDLIANMALGNDVYPYMVNLVNSVITVAKNVVPAVLSIITSIPRMIIDHFPEIKTAITTAITNAITTVQANGPKWLQTVFATLQQIGLAIINGLPGLLARANELLRGVFAWLSRNWPVLISKVWELLLKLGGTLLLRLPSILLKLGQLLVTLVKGILTTAWKTALLSFKTILSGIGQFASNVLQKLSSGLSKVWDVITSPFRKAKETLDGIIDKIKGFFPITLGKIFDGLELPHFKISGGKAPWGIGGAGTAPSVGVEWYKKAENNPYMFRGATLFGAGEAGDEILYGRKALQRDIAAATAANNGVTINVYGGNQTAEEIAEAVERKLIQMQKRTRAAWA